MDEYLLYVEIASNKSGVMALGELSFDLLSRLQRIEARLQELEGQFEMGLDD